MIDTKKKIFKNVFYIYYLIQIDFQKNSYNTKALINFGYTINTIISTHTLRLGF